MSNLLKPLVKSCQQLCPRLQQARSSKKTSFFFISHVRTTGVKSHFFLEAEKRWITFWYTIHMAVSLLQFILNLNPRERCNKRSPWSNVAGSSALDCSRSEAARKLLSSSSSTFVQPELNHIFSWSWETVNNLLIHRTHGRVIIETVNHFLIHRTHDRVIDAFESPWRMQ